jgi:hypothetical protein
MRQHIDVRRALGLVGLSLWLVVGVASTSGAYPLQDAPRSDQSSACALSPRILRLEPELRAHCLNAPTRPEPHVEHPVPGGSSGLSPVWVIWPVVGGGLVLGAAAIGIRLRYRARPAA